MARIVKSDKPAPASPRWMQAGEEVVILALDKNEAEAVRYAVGKFKKATTATTEPTSLNGAGARVYDALRSEGW